MTPGCVGFMPLRLDLSLDTSLPTSESASAHSFPCASGPCSLAALAIRRQGVASGLCLLLIFLITQGSLSPLHAESAKNLYKAGKNAEIREDYITAYQDYRQAWLAKPDDMKYKESYIRLRFLAASQYLDMGRKLRQQGQLNDALTDFLRALAIDPSYEAAQQEVDRTRAKINGTAVQHNPDDSAVTSPQAQQEMQALGGPLHLKPLSNEPITIHLVADSKVIYQTIGKIAGINVLFDPDYTSKRIPIDLNRVTLYDALRSVAFVSQTFWRPVTADTIFIAADTRQKRTELEEQAVQTFYLGNITAPNDLNEVLNAVRNLMDTSVKMQAVPSQSAIVMRGTPDQLLLAQKIIDDLDKTKPEVVVDIAVLEVNKDLLRNIGLQLPGSIGVQLQASTAAATTSTTSTTSTSHHRNHRNYKHRQQPVTERSRQSERDELWSIHRHCNFEHAADGLRYTRAAEPADSRRRWREGHAEDWLESPDCHRIVFARRRHCRRRYQPAGQHSVFLYRCRRADRDAANHPLRRRCLDEAHIIVVSNITSYSNLGGISQPVIGQQDLQQNIRMKEGTANLLGGILQHSKSLTIGGTPGLGEIPFLKYLFSSQQTETVNDEIVFVLIPHLVRRIDLSPLNLRTIDTGTGTNVSLRMNEQAAQVSDGLIQRAGKAPLTFEPSTPPANAAEAANQMAGEIAQRMRNAGQNPGEIPATGTAAGAPLQISLSPQQGVHKVGSTFQMQVNLSGGQDVFSVPMQLHYDPRVLNLVNVDTGNLLAKDGQTTALVHRDDGNGDVTISASRPPGVHGVTGNGNICVLTFQAKASGDATVQVTKSAARNSAQTILPVIAASPAVVHVQ